MTEQLLEKVNSILPTIHGWCCFEKASKFINNIVAEKPQLIVEIGVFGGSSLIPQALALKHNGSGKIYGIDPWTKGAALECMIDDVHKQWWESLDLESIYNHCKENIQKYEVEQYCELIRDKSENVVNQFEDNSIDILHIDGNHSEDLSYKDSTLYFPKVKKGGLIFFDDIFWTEGNNYATTRKAISYLLQFCNKIEIVNNDCMILRKN